MMRAKNEEANQASWPANDGRRTDLRFRFPEALGLSAAERIELILISSNDEMQTQYLPSRVPHVMYF